MMRTLSFFLEDGTFVEKAFVEEVDRSEICPITDIHVASVECNTGWFELYNVDGILKCYWEDDPTSYD